MPTSPEAKLMRQVPVWAWMKDTSGRYVFVNAHVAEAFGRPVEDWLGHTDQELFPDRAVGYRNNDLEVLSSGKPLQTTDLFFRNGQEEYVLVVRFPMESEGEQLLGAIGIDLTQNISALIRFIDLRDELFRTERLRAVGELATGFAHDINNSLNAASTRLHTLRATADAKLEPQLEAIARSLDGAAERVRTLQEFVRAGRESTLEALDLGAIVRDAIEMVDFVVHRTPTVYGGRIRIENRLPPSLPSVQGLPNELKHVLANLFLNARDAMPNGGRITVAANVEPEVVEIAIADQGGGISAENLEKIFKPFFTTKPTGTGLGLSMAQDVLQRIGGKISANNGPEGGAVFTLRFPIGG